MKCYKREWEETKKEGHERTSSLYYLPEKQGRSSSTFVQKVVSTRIVKFRHGAIQGKLETVFNALL